MANDSWITIEPECDILDVTSAILTYYIPTVTTLRRFKLQCFYISGDLIQNGFRALNTVILLARILWLLTCCVELKCTVEPTRRRRQCVPLCNACTVRLRMSIVCCLWFRIILINLWSTLTSSCCVSCHKLCLVKRFNWVYKVGSISIWKAQPNQIFALFKNMFKLITKNI